MALEVQVAKCDRRVADTLLLECDPHCELQIFDAHSTDHSFPEVSIGTKLRVQCGESVPEGADIVMAGHVFARSSRYTFVSCGGLLSKLPILMSATTKTVFLGLTVGSSRNARGKRGRE